MINDYNVVNKYDLTYQTHSTLKCLNNIDEDTIITLKNRSLKGLMTFLIFGRLWHVARLYT